VVDIVVVVAVRDELERLHEKVVSIYGLADEGGVGVGLI